MSLLALGLDLTPNGVLPLQILPTLSDIPFSNDIQKIFLQILTGVDTGELNPTDLSSSNDERDDRDAFSLSIPPS